MFRGAVSVALAFSVFAAACWADGASEGVRAGSPDSTEEPAPSSTVAALSSATTSTLAPPDGTQSDECAGDSPPVTNSRGSACPPLLPAFADGDGGYGGGVLHSAVAGTYQTRLFAVPIEFTQEKNFQTRGDRVDLVNFDQRGPCNPVAIRCFLTTVYAMGPAEFDVSEFSEGECIGAHELGDGMVGGRPATQLDVRSFDCDVWLEVPEGFGPLLISPGERHLILSIPPVRGESLLLVVAVLTADDFDQYMADVAQPMIDSLRFLDD